MATGSVSAKVGKILDIPANAPTIGTATDLVNGGGATVTFTAPSTAVGGPIFDYIATSTPGSVTVTGTSSPLTFSGLTVGTSYTFTVAGRNPSGLSPLSSASNSITPTVPPTSFESIATATPNSTSVTFSSIPQTYKHLQIRGVVRSATYGGAADYYSIRINGDSGANYNASGLGCTNTSVSSFDRNGGQTEIFAGEFPGAVAGADQFGGIVIDIFDYTNTNKNKTIKFYNESIRYGQGSAGINSGLWVNAAAITSISLNGYFGGGFANYSQLALYGIKG